MAQQQQTKTVRRQGKVRKWRMIELPPTDILTGALFPASLITISIIILQAYITLGHLDILGTIIVVIFSITIPLLAMSFLVNNRMKKIGFFLDNKLYRFYLILDLTAIILNIIGIALTIFRISIVGGICFLISVFVGLTVYALYDKELDILDPDSELNKKLSSLQVNNQDLNNSKNT